ncbi:MAG: NrdH-redoxin [Candidatus Colwellbacteria bacterium CG10_big_fil_rev_8_21_14_0_10_41_28]|uniref:NrdH-redoxin n=1 Tax=Candidatus Colwellbacteria bacterium CG10_big_fil_rev_8_21_14_0_10_41_28 TaxID=1974539 RepID=A0A2H0VK34_9BACT|nr:MAG: NrdH-redoxin [Candidatus Colwellbacteria bacterium CG10_big_fil_rev_8_21_14_0_10_41_28]
MTKALIYTTPTCQYCTMVKAFFKENDVTYEEKDVSVDQDALKEMVERSGQMGVPVTIIEDSVVVGFDKRTLEELIK